MSDVSQQNQTMSPPQEDGERITQQEFSDLIGIIFPRNRAKRLARMLNAPVNTARWWIWTRFSEARLAESAAGLLAELDRQDREERDGARRRLREIITKSMDGFVACGSTGASDDSD